MAARKINRRAVLRGLSRCAVLGLATRGAAGIAVGTPKVQSPGTVTPGVTESPMRRVWLRLLVNAVEADARAGKEPSKQQRFVAGLTSVRFLYLDDLHKDIILEGPFDEDWTVRADGIAIGQATGRPILQLDDFAVAWRNTVQNAPPPSVDLRPRVESMQRLQEIIRTTPQPKNAAAREEYTRRLQDVWGPQDAITGGVPTSTRFNKVMVDADWEMKRISLGLSDAGVDGLRSYIDLEFDDWRKRVMSEGIRTRRPEGGSRFWFYPAYADFPHSGKLDAFEIPPDPVHLLTEGHFRDLSHGRQVTPEPSQTAREFVRGFTELYASLAAKNPLFAELRNLFDWVAISRLIQKIEAPDRLGWDLGYLTRAYPIARLAVPSTMPGQIGLRHAEVRAAQGLASLVLPARGGVSIQVAPRWRDSSEPRLGQRAGQVRARAPGPGLFWN